MYCRCRVPPCTSCTAHAPPLPRPQVVTEVWLVSEFCNRGPLLTAIERGAFLTQPSSQYGQPNLISVLQVAAPAARPPPPLHRLSRSCLL